MTQREDVSHDSAGAMEVLRPGDTYLEGPYVVFTAQYHLRRGYCCNSGCRHCPFRAGEGADHFEEPDTY